MTTSEGNQDGGQLRLRRRIRTGTFRANLVKRGIEAIFLRGGCSEDGVGPDLRNAVILARGLGKRMRGKENNLAAEPRSGGGSGSPGAGEDDPHRTKISRCLTYAFCRSPILPAARTCVLIVAPDHAGGDPQVLRGGSPTNEDSAFIMPCKNCRGALPMLWPLPKFRTGTVAF